MRIRIGKVVWWMSGEPKSLVAVREGRLEEVGVAADGCGWGGGFWKGKPGTDEDGGGVIHVLFDEPLLVTWRCTALIEEHRVNICVCGGSHRHYRCHIYS